MSHLFSAPRRAIHSGPAALLACLFFQAACSAQPSGLQSESEDSPAEKLPPALTEYKGRAIAPVMTFEGADWLVRESREREEACQELLKVLDIKPGMVICDMGCGNGYYSLQLAEKVGEDGKVLAVDIQPEMLRLLDERAKEAGVEHIEPILGSLIDPKLPDESCDLILMVDVYHEFSHPEHMLQAIRKALKPDGKVVLVEFRAEDPKVPIKELHKMSKKQILKEWPPNGYKLVDEYDKLPWQHVMFFGRAEEEGEKREEGRGKEEEKATDVEEEAEQVDLAKKRLHKLAIDAHYFLDLNKRLPAQASYDDKGKPLLSWRVHLLKFTNPDLYDQFVLAQPWDSEHNRKLIPEMPDDYKSPGEDLGEGKTCFLAVVGDSTIFPPGPPPKGRSNLIGDGPISEGAVIDGLSNTLLFVEAAPKSAVVWTQPNDWEIDVEKPTKGLFGMRRDGALAVFADASVRTIPKTATEESILYAAGRHDRMPYSFDVPGKRDKDR